MPFLGLSAGTSHRPRIGYNPETEVCANTIVLLDAENTVQPDALLRRLSEHGGLTLVNDDGYLTGPPAFTEVSLGRTEQQRNKG